VTAVEIETLAASFFAAIEAGDVATMTRLYAPDAVVWHDFDSIEQSVDDNLVVLGWMIDRVAHRRYEDVRRVIVDDGFVQQHVLRGDAPGGFLDMPAMMRVHVADGRITRVEEYLDPADAAVLRGSHPPAPSAGA
jgi:ketosteroid isomerase-like protein